MSSKGDPTNDVRSDNAPKSNKRKAKVMSSSSTDTSRTLSRSTPSRGNSGSSQSSITGMETMSNDQKLEGMIKGMSLCFFLHQITNKYAEMGPDYYTSSVRGKELFIDVFKVKSTKSGEKFAASLYYIIDDSRTKSKSNPEKDVLEKGPAMPDEFFAKLLLQNMLALKIGPKGGYGGHPSTWDGPR